MTHRTVHVSKALLSDGECARLPLFTQPSRKCTLVFSDGSEVAGERAVAEARSVTTCVM